MYVVDASVWVSRMLPSDRYHQPSLRWLRLARGELFAGPVVLLTEIGGPVARMMGQAEVAARIVSVVRRLSYVRLYPVSESFARFSADLAAQLRLRGADALYVALASRMGIPLVTWDSEQLQRGRGAATTVTPEELLAGTAPPPAG